MFLKRILLHFCHRYQTLSTVQYCLLLNHLCIWHSVKSLCSVYGAYKHALLASFTPDVGLHNVLQCHQAMAIGNVQISQLLDV